MLQKHVYSQWLTAISALLVAGSALAAAPKSQEAEAKAIREKLETMDKFRPPGLFSKTSLNQLI